MRRTAVVLAAAALLLGAGPALAHDGHGSSGSMDMSGMADMPGMDHSSMDHSTMDHSSHSTPAAHDHGSSAHAHGAATASTGPSHRTRLAVVGGFLVLNLWIMAAAAARRVIRPRRA